MPDLAAVRFFIDEDLIAVGRGLMELRDDVATARQEPIRNLVPALDPDWIPIIADRGWVAITNDKHIRTRFDEATVAIRHALRCVHLRPPKRNTNRWGYVRLIAKHWDAIEALTESEGPAWLAVTDRSTRHLSYDPGKPPRLPPASGDA